MASAGPLAQAARTPATLSSAPCPAPTSQPHLDPGGRVTSLFPSGMGRAHVFAPPILSGTLWAKSHWDVSSSPSPPASPPWDICFSVLTLFLHVRITVSSEPRFPREFPGPLQGASAPSTMLTASRQGSFSLQPPVVVPPTPPRGTSPLHFVVLPRSLSSTPARPLHQVPGTQNRGGGNHLMSPHSAHNQLKYPDARILHLFQAELPEVCPSRDLSRHLDDWVTKTDLYLTDK